MSDSASKKAIEFVRDAKLPPAPTAPKRKEGVPGLAPTPATASGVAEFDFDKNKNQALVVGSDIISFVKGVTEEQRQDIVNSALLAQLIANAKVKNKTHIFKWYDAYFDALTHI